MQQKNVDDMKENKNKTVRESLFKIPQTPQRIRQNIWFAVGLVFLIVGTVLTAIFYGSAEEVNLGPFCVLIFIGALFLFFGMGFVRSSVMVFFGVMFFLIGVPILLRAVAIINISNFQMIPYAMICAGFALFVAGLYKARKIRSSYIFPAAALVVLGSFFLLFSTGILHFSLTTFVSRWFPLLLLLLGVTLVVVFYVQQIMKKNFPYIDEDHDGSLCDEENE